MEGTVPDQRNDRGILSAASTSEATPVHPIEDGAAAMARSPYLSASFSGTSHCSSPLARLQEASHVRSNSFQRRRQQMHRAWRRGPGGNNGNSRNDNGSREQGLKKTLNLEVLANQKRQWYRIKSKLRVKTCSLAQLPRYKELVSGLGPIHARLSCKNSISKRHPVYRCSEVQVNLHPN